MPVTDIFLSFLAKIMPVENLSPSNKPSVPLFFPSVLIGFLVEAGHAEKDILAGTNITSAELQSPDIRVNYAVHSRLIANAENLWGHPGLGLSFGSTLNLFSLGMVGQAAISSRSLGDAMETIARYLSLRSPLLAFTIDREADGISFILSGTRELGDNRRFMVEAAFAAVSKFLTQLAGKKLDGLSFELQHKMTGSEDIYTAALGPNVRFERPSEKFYMPGPLAKIPLPTANSMSAVEARRYCEAEIKRLGVDDGFKEIVGAALRSRLASPPTEKETSKLLGYSARNLRRRLNEENTSYRNLLNSIRQESARKYLTTTHLTIEEIAFEIGYRNVGNFSRAFKRWTGTSPSAFRRRPAEYS